jgi:hypothetical protein
MSMKNSNENIGNRTRDLPTCSAVPQFEVHVKVNEDNCEFNIIGSNLQSY